MKKYIVVYHAPAAAWEQMKDMTPEDHKKGMEPWNVWMKKVGKGLVDMGAPLTNGQLVTKSGTTKSQSDVAGYSILQAKNMNEATKLLQHHPHLEWAQGCKIEVFETKPMG